MPLDFLRQITMPPGYPEAWSRLRAAIFGPFALTMFMYVFGFDPFGSALYIYLGALGATVVLGIFLFMTTHIKKHPSYLVGLSFIAFIMGITWINLFAGILVD